MARDKFYEARMQGMIYALNIAKEQGVEGLDLEIRKRNLLEAPFAYSNKEIDEFWKRFAELFYNNVLVSALWALYSEFDFRKERLKRFKEAFDKAVFCANDYNYMGEHYVKMEDYAVELNEKCKMQLDVQAVAAIQDADDERRKDYKDTSYLKGIINSLRLNGYYDAAEFLNAKISKAV